jgi:hypothetical protein
MNRVAPLALLASLVLVSCANDDNSQSQATPSASPTPAKADPNVLSGLVVRFYRDVNTPTPTWSDLERILSWHFLKAHEKDWTRAYGFMSDARVSVDSVRDRALDYTVDYTYVGSNKGKVTWERKGTWYFVHGGRIGWRLDGDDWKSIHITSVVEPDGKVYSVQDKVYTDGRHTFDIEGATYAFVPANNGWSVAVVATPTPPPPPAGSVPYAPAPDANQDTQPREPGYGAAANPSYVAPAPEADCEEVSVQGVYHDGEVLELDDGRYLRVSDVDTVTSEVWVAPFDGLICDGGDTLINKDENESVELQP